MKEISQEEFEKYIWAIARGKMSLAQVIRELNTESRTLNNKIQELSATNPELYKAYIEKHSYKPKERKDLDAMQLAIEVLKQEKTMARIAEEYGTGVRTIRRRLDTLKSSDNALERKVYELCREVCNNNSRASKNSPQLDIEVREMLEILEEMNSEETYAKMPDSNIEQRRQELLAIEKRYNELCMKMSKTEAAKEMGYTTNRIYKLLNELYRIEIELQAKKKDNFRHGLQVNVETTAIEQEPINETKVEKEREQ